MAIAIWIGAAFIYLVFRLWYDGMGKPITADELKRYSQLITDQGMDSEATNVLRKFMAEDDGKEFLMANLALFHPSPVTHPDTGQDMKAFDLLQDYYKPFMGKMLRRAGHPAIGGRRVGGYLDAWNTPPDPGWDVCGMIRYRSRRDALESSFADPAFAAG